MKLLRTWITVLAFLLGMFVVTVVAAHAKVGDKPNSRLDGLFMANQYVNPHQYTFGYVKHSFIVQTKKGATWTIVEWKPYGTPLLYRETLILCGDHAMELSTAEPLVIMYSRAVNDVMRIDKPVEILACHSLDGAKTFKETQ